MGDTGKVPTSKFLQKSMRNMPFQLAQSLSLQPPRTMQSMYRQRSKSLKISRSACTSPKSPIQSTPCTSPKTDAPYEQCSGGNETETSFRRASTLTSPKGKSVAYNRKFSNDQPLQMSLCDVESDTAQTTTYSKGQYPVIDLSNCIGTSNLYDPNDVTNLELEENDSNDE